MLALRFSYTAVVMTLVVWLLLAGRFGEAVLAVVLAVWVRRKLESATAPARTR